MAELQSLADKPGTLREYETIYILRPNTLNDGVADVNTKVKEIIETRGGKVINVDNWGKRRLSYEIKKELRGIYLYWQYLGNPAIVAEFERNMRMLDSVVRYMTVKLDSDIDPGARPAELDEDAYEKAATTAADEEELMMRRSDVQEYDEYGYPIEKDDDEGEVKAAAEAAAEAPAEAPAAEPAAEAATEEKTPEEGQE